MFILRYFGISFRSLTKTLHLRKEKLWKILIYFFILNIIATFPLNLSIVRQGGWRMDFVAEQLQSSPPTWFPMELPSSCSIGYLGLICPDYQSYTFTDGDYMYVFNQEIEGFVATQKTVLLSRYTLTYLDQSGASITTDYSGFDRQIDFMEWRNNPETVNENIVEFSEGIENSLAPYIIIFSVFSNLGTNILMNTIFILLFGWLLMAFKIGHNRFMSYIEAIKLSIISMTIPVSVGFFFGLAGGQSTVFSVLVVSFGVPLMMMLLIKKPGKVEFQQRV